MDYKFTDLVDISELQELLVRFDRTPDLSFDLVDTDGNTIMVSDLKTICPGFHGVGKTHVEKCIGDKAKIEFLGTTKNECRLYSCSTGLACIEIPVLFKGKYLATAISGQFFLQEPKPEDFKEHEDCLLHDSALSLSPVSQIPVLSKNDINEKIDCFNLLMHLLLSSGFNALKINDYESKIESYEKESLKNKEKLDSLKKMKNTLMSSFSHELKTPLSIIKGYTELLHDGCLGSVNKEQEKALDNSLLNVGKLERIIDSLLYLGREHSNEHFYESNPLNILDVIEASTISLTRSFASKNLRVQTNYPERVPIIYGDGKKLFHVLSHMLDNAIKFSPSGSTVTISVKETTEHLQLSIQDRGVGIIEEHLSHIFDDFYQGDGSLTRRYSGVGIGLNICQRIIQRHEGNISVESKVNQGSTFHIKLPKKDDFKSSSSF